MMIEKKTRARANCREKAESVIRHIIMFNVEDDLKKHGKKLVDRRLGATLNFHTSSFQLAFSFCNCFNMVFEVYFCDV